MTDWSAILLGVIAAGVLVMAVVQVGALVSAARLARRVDRLATQIERDVAPLVTNLQTIGAEAARASTLAAAQVERADRLFAEVAGRVEETAATVQQAIMAPAREGAAVVAGLRAVLTAIGDSRRAARSRATRPEEDDPLFIG